jgi:hypothetical protein
MAKDVEVRTKLKLDDLASSVLNKIQGEFKQTDVAQKQVQSGFSEFGQTFAAQFAAVNLAPAIGQVWEFGKGLVRAGLDGQEADKSIAGMIASAQGAPWNQALAQGSAYGDMLDTIALKAGQTGNDVEGGFMRILEITGATAEGIKRARDTTESLAVVSNKLHKSTAQIGGEYAFMAEGVLKTKGQLFQLLQPTGIFGDKTKGAAEAWAKLTDAKRLELLQYGMGKVAGSLASAPPTMSDLITKLQTMGNIASEKFGQGLVEELVPGFESLMDELMGGRGEIETMADEMGREVGRAVKDAAREVRAGYAYVKEHYAEIKGAVVTAFDHAKKVVGWILDHKEEIAMAFGAKVAIGGAKGLLGSPGVKMGTSLVKGAAEVGKGLGPALEAGALGSSMAKLTGLLGPAGVGVAGLAVGVAALGTAAWATSAIIDEQNAETTAHLAANANILEAALAGDVKKTEDLVEAMHSLGGGINSLGQAIGEVDRATAEFHANLRKIAESTASINEVDAESTKAAIDLATRGIQDAYQRASSDTSKAGQDYADNLYANQTFVLINAYNQAARSGNTALMQLAATTLASSKGTQAAFLAAGKDVEGGFATLADLVASSSADFATKLRAKVPSDAPKPAAPVMNVGSMTVNIKQTVEADPDRIAIILRKDLMTAAIRRYTQSTGTLFGG